METEQPVACRGIRGAITVETNGPEAVSEATAELLAALVRENGCQLEDIAAASFTVPDDPRTDPVGGVCTGVIAGIGWHSYGLALEALCSIGVD